MKNHKGFTLIELMIVVAIIAIIASISVPGILSARRTANASAALANLKAFSTSMATYSQDQADQSYPENDEIFGDYYSHIPIKGGYEFVYSVNTSLNPSKFVYSAQPTAITNATKAFFVDESNRLWYVNLKDNYTKTNITPNWDELGANRMSMPNNSKENAWQKKP